MTYEASVILPTGKIRVTKHEVRFTSDMKLERSWALPLAQADKIFEALAAQIKLALEL